MYYNMGPSDAPTILMYLINLLIIACRFEIVIFFLHEKILLILSMHMNATHKQRYLRKGLDGLKVIVSMLSVSYSVRVSYLV